MASDPADARKALRDFYKLQASAAPKDNSSPDSNLTSTPSSDGEIGSVNAGNEATKDLHSAIDDPKTDIDEWAKQIVDESDIIDLMNTHGTMLREQAALASAERELVNDNYKKLIQAAETLKYLSAQGALAGLEDLTEPVDLISEIVKASEAPDTPTDDHSLWQRFITAREEFISKYESAS